jgi:hypothetical protein
MNRSHEEFFSNGSYEVLDLPFHVVMPSHRNDHVPPQLQPNYPKSNRLLGRVLKDNRLSLNERLFQIALEQYDFGRCQHRRLVRGSEPLIQ